MTLMWQSLSKLGEGYRGRGKVKKRQEKWLLSCLERNRKTCYGQRFGFEDICSIEDYRENVPLISYEHISSWIERVASGESDVLFEGLPIAFERTGGSSGGSKLVPYSNKSLMDFRAAILPWLADAIVMHGLGNGCAYLAISPATRQPEQTSGGISVGLPDCAYLGDDVLSALSELSAVPQWVATVPSVSDWQLATLYWLVRRNDLEMISVWSPTFFLTLMDGLEHRFSELDALLRQGGVLFQQTLQPDSTALSRLGRYAKNKDARTLWPNLKLVSCWQDASSKSFFDELKHRLPQAAFQGKGLLATEGVVTVPDREGRLALAADSGFFEFLDDGGYSWFAHELECGTRYEVVMTTSGGLYRYRTGDCVICEGIGENLPLLRFMGRRGLVSDMVGEKLTEEFVADCLISCLDGIPGFHMLVPYVRAKPQYVLVMDECTGIQTEAFTISIEESLSRNPQYAYARRMGQLDSLSVLLLANPLVSYVNRVIKNGARLGDVKVPALRPETDWLETFLES